MSQFTGQQDRSGPKNGRKNKGVMATRRAIKRGEAEARNALTPPERRSTKRALSS